MVVTVAGESGSGKSGIALCLAEAMFAEGAPTLVLCQDDYFRLPPATNRARRQQGLDWVGPAEVDLDLLDDHLTQLVEHPDRPLTKPLVDFDADRIEREIIPPEPWRLIVVEGTYVSLLARVDMRVFLDRNRQRSLRGRLARSREPETAFLDRVLAIEHRVISSHRSRADLVVR